MSSLDIETAEVAMVRLFHKASKKLGQMPGSIVYVGKERVHDVRIDVMDFTATELHVQERVDIEACASFKDSPSISWLNVSGIHDIEVAEKLGSQFGITDLVLEDIVNTGQRPRLEESGDHVCAILKMLYADDSGNLKVEQVSIVFGQSWMLSFQETAEDVFEPVRNRIRRTVPRVRFLNADYLAYALIDAIVDHYFVVLETMGERIEDVEDAISDGPRPEELTAIRELKKQLIFMRKVIWPVRELVAALERSESNLIMSPTGPYLRDLYDHTVQVIDTVETFREMVSGLLDLYHTSVSNRMNEVMKVLTIFATIFIPLGFLAGVYGMNFDTVSSPFNMPELGFRFGYILFWALALTIAGGFLWYFRRKEWL